VVAGLLLLSVVASLIWPPENQEETEDEQLEVTD